MALEIEIKIRARVENSETVGLLIVGRDLPGLLVITTDHAYTVLDITLNTKIFTSAVPDTEEAITSIFEGPLLIGASINSPSDYVLVVPCAEIGSATGGLGVDKKIG